MYLDIFEINFFTGFLLAGTQQEGRQITNH
jgi:hypothetical protein